MGVVETYNRDKEFQGRPWCNFLKALVIKSSPLLANRNVDAPIRKVNNKEELFAAVSSAICTDIGGRTISDDIFQRCRRQDKFYRKKTKTKKERRDVLADLARDNPARI